MKLEKTKIVLKAKKSRRRENDIKGDGGSTGLPMEKKMKVDRMVYKMEQQNRRKAMVVTKKTKIAMLRDSEDKSK